MMKKKTSEIYREALAELWDGVGPKSSVGNEFICWCIIIASGMKIGLTSMEDMLRRMPKDYRKAIKIIENRLYTRFTMESWLSSQGFEEIWSMANRKPAVQEHRRRWLELLIAEFEAKGD
jgi:DNA-binding ferritin-like protein (Dps family)